MAIVAVVSGLLAVREESSTVPISVNALINGSRMVFHVLTRFCAFGMDEKTVDGAARQFLCILLTECAIHEEYTMHQQ